MSKIYGFDWSRARFTLHYRALSHGGANWLLLTDLSRACRYLTYVTYRRTAEPLFALWVSNFYCSYTVRISWKIGHCVMAERGEERVQSLHKSAMKGVRKQRTQKRASRGVQISIRGLFKKYRDFWIFAGYVRSIFEFLVALCWYAYPSLMATSSAILKVQLIFDSYFVWTCFGSSSIFAYFQKMDRRICIKFSRWTVNNEYYVQVMHNLREAIRQKRPNLWKNKNWLLHHDNALAHTSLLVREFLTKNNNVAAATVFPRSASPVIFLVPETEEAKIEDEPKHVQTK